MIYRLATENDISEIGELVKSAIVQMEKYDIYQWDHIYPTVDDFGMDLNKKQLFVGILNEDIAVVYVINKECDDAYQTAEWKYPNSEFRVIHRLCVNPKCQNQGVAKNTLRHIESELLKEKVETIRLDVYTENPFALSLYQNNGYAKVGFADWRKGRFFLMEKHL